MAKKKIFSGTMGLVIFLTLIFLALSMGEQKGVAQAQCLNFGLKPCTAAAGGVFSGYADIDVYGLKDPIYLCLTQG